MLISSSAGSRWTGETRHRSSYSRRMASDCDCSGDMSIPRDDCESFACIIKESLSSSIPRSGEVEAELLLELDTRCNRRERAMVVRLVVNERVCCSARNAFSKPQTGDSYRRAGSVRRSATEQSRVKPRGRVVRVSWCANVGDRVESRPMRMRV